ncbi:hypothetical protein BpHYR1_054533 [Brachionus plicatilis]|uniref:DUF4139 domain-containing protein n=1 Tax=Brachionus plicatilis TaxID=10195 RepID=A0A3M7RF77_BRAPC|nr:hypothetical protein BpHYR1_054533 [Brachionus plicatilis]
MIINYFGLIKQTTGEDWNDTKVSLSTAVPSIGGNVPDLPTHYVRIKPKFKARSFQASVNSSFKKKKSDKLHLASGFLLEEDEYGSELSSMNELKTEACSSSLGSTITFNIPRKANIPSDGKTHKVSIAILNLSPEFEYETVPRKNTHAYIKAKVLNTSDYALLAGPANVFLDNNFVAKTNLKAYKPNLKNHPNIKLNKENNLEFRLKIQPNKMEELSIKYLIECSSHKEIQFY